MARSGPVLVAAAAAIAAACSYSFDVPEDAQIACAAGGAPCPEGWTCEAGIGRCVRQGGLPQILVNPTSITTTESDAGTPVSVQVFLSSRPSAAVTLPVSSSEPSEATVSPPSITIQPADWNRLASLVVSGVDDPEPVSDGTRPYTIHLGPAVSGDPNFNGITAYVSGQNLDNDSPGVLVDPTAGVEVYEGYSFGGGFSVVLFTEPAADVSITFTSLDTDAVSVEAPATVVFDASNWSTPQWVSLTGVDNQYDETDRPWTIRPGNTVSADPSYSGLTVPDITGTTIDDDTPGYSFNPAWLTADENGGPIQVTVTLLSRPYGTVTLQPSSSSPGVATVSPSTLDFDASNWSTGLPMTITPVDDQVRDGDVSFNITFAAVIAPQDPGYQGLTPYPLSATVADDERIIFTLATPVNGDLSNGGFYPDPDGLCYQQGNPDLINPYPLALLASDGPTFWRVATTTPYLGDGQYNWVLTAGRQYLSETRDGRSIGRANGSNLFDFPLATELTGAGDYWTGLRADWTTSDNDCGSWFNASDAASGEIGTAGAVDATAISSSADKCIASHRLICVEQ